MRAKNQIAKLENGILRAALVVAIGSLFAACTKGGSISSSSSTSTVSGSITVTKVFPTAQTDSWTPIQASSRFYIKGLALTIEGTCTRGINTVQINEGGANYPEIANCNDDGTWTFNKVYTAGAQEGDKSLTIAAYDVSGLAISGTNTTTLVRIDNTAPALPVVTSPAATPDIEHGGSANYNILGTCAADVDHITGPAGAVIVCASGLWNYNAVLAPGSSVDFTFYSWDLAGNQSAGFTQTISFIPDLNLLVKNVISGGMITDSGSGFKMEASADMMPSNKVDGVSNYNVLTGFNYIINEVRAH